MDEVPVPDAVVGALDREFVALSRFSQVAEAQTDFIAKRYPGKLVMVPDRLVAPASEQEGE